MKYNIVRNMTYAAMANMISIIVSILTVIIVPHYVSVETYGLWQLFLFYMSYSGFFHFGWADGIYLRYAGMDFNQLDERKFAGQIYGIILLQIIVALAIVSYAYLFLVDDPKRQFILYCTAAGVVIANFNTICNFIFEFTNMIKRYSYRIIMERVLFILLIVGCLIFSPNSYQNIIICQLFGIIVVAACSGYSIRNLLRFSFPDFKEICTEAWMNLSVGIKLMIANVASMLVLGVFRYSISVNWSVSIFGQISLMLSVSMFMLSFVNTISIAFFPFLKRINLDEMVILYKKVRCLLSLVLFTAFLYYPIRIVLFFWLPKYGDSIVYMGAFFPICYYESRFSFLIGNYYKSLRKEKELLLINVGTVILCVTLLFFGVYILNNLIISIFFLNVVFCFRCFISELYIADAIRESFKRISCIELIVCSMFIVANMWGTALCGLLIYLMTYIIYIYINKVNILALYDWITKSNLSIR